MTAGGDLTLFDDVVGEPAPEPRERTDGEALDRHVTSTARPVESRAHARRWDPITSHAAAASVSIAALTASQHLVKRLLAAAPDGLTLEELVDVARANDVPLSDSRLRTACSELVDAGVAADSGDKRLTRSRRAAVVWHLTPEPQGEAHP